MANLEFCDKHNMVAYLVKSESSAGFHKIIDFLTSSHIYYALTECPTLYISLIEQFWQTAAFSTTEDGVRVITATIDGRDKIITEASIRRHLKLQDSEGLTSLPNADIFEQLTRMGYAITSDSLTFLKGHFAPQWKFFIHTILHCMSSKKTAWDQFSSNIATAIICLATNRVHPNTFEQTTKTTFASYQNLFHSYPYKQTIQQHEESIQGILWVVTPLFDTMLVQPLDEAPSTSPSRITSSPSLSSHHTTSSTLTTPPSIQTTHEADETATMIHDSPLPRGYTPGSDEGRLKHNKLMKLVTKLSDRVVAIEEDLKQTKKAYSIDFTKLVLKVKKLEQQVRSGKAKRRARIVLSEDEDVAEDPSKQGRKIAQIDTDPTISLVRDEGTSWFQEDVETREKNSADTEVLLEEETPTLCSQNRPYSVAEVRKNMVRYLINQGGYKQRHFKGMSYQDIRPIFEKVWDQNQVFVPMGSEIEKEHSKPVEEETVHQEEVKTEQVVKESSRKTRGRRKKSLARKRVRETQSEESSKKQKLEDDAEKEELRLGLKIVSDEDKDIDYEVLDMKYPIVDWESQILGNLEEREMHVYKITRADGKSKYYSNLSGMLDTFDRE
ncbi:hypothetical protein Tco_0474754 [Tanacetum coccineum]